MLGGTSIVNDEFESLKFEPFGSHWLLHENADRSRNDIPACLEIEIHPGEELENQG